MNKNILVISHPRSGTHFLINTIARNFNSNNDWYVVPAVTDQNVLKNFFKDVSSDRIFKSHHNFKVLEPLLPIIHKRFKVFYIMRDGRDVMTSMWYFFNYANPKMFPHTKSVGELMREDPTKWKMGGEYDLKDFSNYVERWVNHTKLWWDYINSNDKIELVRYENLNHPNNFYGCVYSIGAFLNRTSRIDMIRPTLHDRGVLNRKGIVGDHIKHFTNDDYLFYKSIAGENMLRLKYYE